MRHGDVASRHLGRIGLPKAPRIVFGGRRVSALAYSTKRFLNVEHVPDTDQELSLGRELKVEAARMRRSGAEIRHISTQAVPKTTQVIGR